MTIPTTSPPGTCSCVAKVLPTVDPTEPPAEQLHIKGRLHFMFAIGLRQFVAPESEEAFEWWRGSVEYMAAIRALKVRTTCPFVLDTEEDAAVETGFELGAFRTHIKKDWLFGTFRLDPDRIPPDALSNAHVRDYECRIRLSRLGLLEIKLTRTFEDAPGASATLIDMLHHKASLRSGALADPQGESRSAQLSVAIACARLFVGELNQIGFSIADPTRTAQPIRIRFMAKEKELRPVRERYLTLEFTDILCPACGTRLSPQTLITRYPNLMPALLEGNLVSDTQKGTIRLPQMDSAPSPQAKPSPGFVDFGSWDSDLCAFASEVCVIYYDVKARMELYGHQEKGGIANSEYWRCIMRGIENTVALRAGLRLIELRTEEDMNALHRVFSYISAHGVAHQADAQRQQLIRRVARNMSLMPALRAATVAANAYRGRFAVAKFRYLFEDVWALDKMLTAAQSNMLDIVRLLNLLKDA